MKNLTPILVILLAACTSSIKNEKSEKTDYNEETVYKEVRPEPTENLNMKSKEDLIGYWVGWFQPDLNDEELLQLSAKNYYPSSNKINISIDKINGDSVFGHSVVANNNRPFKGVLKSDLGWYNFSVVEPGDDQHDGSFTFGIREGDSTLSGTWVAYNTSLNVPKRKYKLEKRIFKYNASNPLTDWFADETKQPKMDTMEIVDMLNGRSWEETLISNYRFNKEDVDLMSQEDKQKALYQMLQDWTEGDGEFYSVTDKFDEYNSSTDTLTSEYVSELSKADIYILRNSIFARHGYSFKKKDLRRYFDRQDWYIPVHADIRSDLTDLEKQNIKILLAYEEHAEEYYDYFGR